MRYFIYIFLIYYINGEQKPIVTAYVLTESTFSFYVPDLGQTTWDIKEQVKYAYLRSVVPYLQIKAVYVIEKNGVRGYLGFMVLTFDHEGICIGWLQNNF